MSRITKIVLVCEGWRDSVFSRGFLEEAGVDRRSIDPRVNPGGSGHDWVKTEFVEEVANLQRFSEGRGVLGMIDEDGKGVTAREREVLDRLRAHGLDPIKANDGRCLLLPTRNIETWLYWLKAKRSGETLFVSETTDYKSTPPAGVTRLVNSDCRPAGTYLHSLDHRQPPQGCPPMLVKALEQLREFINAVRR